MSIVRSLRQTILDHDPKTGTIVGGTKIFQRQYVEGEKIEQLPNESEDLSIEKVPELWGGTSDVHAEALRKTEDILAAEREQRQQDAATAKAEIERLNGLLEAEAQANQAMTAKLSAIVKVLNS